MPKVTAVFDADDGTLSGALARINGRMPSLQSRSPGHRKVNGAGVSAHGSLCREAQGHWFTDSAWTFCTSSTVTMSPVLPHALRT